MKELTFENGTPRDACDHDVVDCPGANAVCRKCGTVDPAVEEDGEQ